MCKSVGRNKTNKVEGGLTEKVMIKLWQNIGLEVKKIFTFYALIIKEYYRRMQNQENSPSQSDTNKLISQIQFFIEAQLEGKEKEEAKKSIDKSLKIVRYRLH